jgi:hypothetical protein
MVEDFIDYYRRVGCSAGAGRVKCSPSRVVCAIEAMPGGMRFIPHRQPRCTRSGVVQWDEKDPSVRPLGRAREVRPWLVLGFRNARCPSLFPLLGGG